MPQGRCALAVAFLVQGLGPGLSAAAPHQAPEPEVRHRGDPIRYFAQYSDLGRLFSAGAHPGDLAPAPEACSDTCAHEGLEPLYASPLAGGDPHLRNLRGEGFDVLREGIATLLEFPRQERRAVDPSFRVEASIEHPGNGTRCKGYFIEELWITGSLVGEPIHITTGGDDLWQALDINIGGTAIRRAKEVANFTTNGKYKMYFVDDRMSMTERHVHNRNRFASLRLQFIGGVGLEVNWLMGKHVPARLDFNAEHLRKLGDNWGGILGYDDHGMFTAYDQGCEKSAEYTIYSSTQLALLGAYDPWEAIATLE